MNVELAFLCTLIVGISIGVILGVNLVRWALFRIVARDGFYERGDERIVGTVQKKEFPK